MHAGLYRRLTPLGLALLLVLTGCALIRPQARLSAVPTTGLPPLVVQFDGRSSSSPNGPIIDYHWAFGDGNEAFADVVSHTYREKGTFTATLTVTDIDGKTADSSIDIVVVNVPPTASFKAQPAVQLKHMRIYFDATASTDPDGEIVEYFWEFDDGEVDYGQTVTHFYSEFGVYMVKLTVVDDDGLESSAYEIVQIVGCGSCP
jgi:PKD repeat protein